MNSNAKNEAPQQQRDSADASQKPAIGVIGVGWVGLVTASCFAELGHPVWAMDIDAEKVALLSSGESLPIYEPGLPELVSSNRERLNFTTSMDEVLESARLLFCCVDTPPTYSGDADLSRVQAVVAALPEGDRHALVMKSTVPAGTGAAIRRGKPGLPYVSCPEFLKEGTAVEDFMRPDRVVVGADEDAEWAAEMVADAYAPLGGEIVRTDVASAEMIKLASNAFLATKISFINEIANVCEGVGADVREVARGMGLDARIGPKFLQAGIGYGGSCFAPQEMVLVRVHGAAKLLTFEQLWELVADDEDEEATAPADLRVWSWVPGEAEPEWMPVSVLSRRAYEGEIVEVRTKMGRRVSVTPDHPFVAGDGKDGAILTLKSAADLDTDDWLPLASGAPQGFAPQELPITGAVGQDCVPAEEVLVRIGDSDLDAISAVPLAERGAIFPGHRAPNSRWHDVRRSGVLRLPEAGQAGLSLHEAMIGTARNGTFAPLQLSTDERFWRVLGLYLAEGCISGGPADGGRRRIIWSFHPTAEEHLVREVADYWQSQNVRVSIRSTATARRVEVSSRLLAGWWTDVLGLGRNSLEQRLPDLAWEQTAERKRALLSGLWEGDGSWSLINGGPSVILEWGTISDELADGVARLLADLGIVASWRRGRTAKSTKLTHWLRVSGAEQIGRAMFLVPARHREQVVDCIQRQRKQIRPTGFRRFLDGEMPWVRVVETQRRPFSGSVYSLEVPGSHTAVVSGGLVAHNCFPKDVSALKMLAGNTGYHFQLLNSVIEVNELQKRRVISKLTKHLGSLVGRRVALLGLAFKPNTDDMREASSLVLSARLQGEGAVVVAYDPVAEDRAGELLPSVELQDSAASALEGADAAILVTEWPEFAELDWAQLGERMANRLIVDGRNYLDPEGLRAAGFTYEGIGRAGQAAGGA